MENQPKIHPALAALIVIVLIGASTALATTMNSKQASTAPAQTTTTPKQSAATNASTSSPVATSTLVKDGQYTANGTYATPGGNESIGLSVTLKSGVIEDITLTQNPTGGETAEYQNRFASSYKQLVVGKNISSIRLSRVAGSSLTSNGFNDALDQIQQNAAS